MLFELTEASRESEMALIGHGLIAKEQDFVVQEGPLDFSERPIVEILAQAHASDVGTDGRTHGRDLYTLVALGFDFLLQAPQGCALSVGQPLAGKHFCDHRLLL